MKIGIFQDLHANLPAFKKALAIFEQHNCQRIYHVGDLIGIGPHPKEVFDLAQKTAKLTCVMGNHDYWFAFGLSDSRSASMSSEERAHQEWNHAQIGPENRAIVQQWKFVEELTINEHQKISFVHYGYDEEVNWFKNYVKTPNQVSMDELFLEMDSALIFYGHHHEASDITGHARYVNLGSAGCYSKPEVRLGILHIEKDKFELKKIAEPYDDEGLMDDFELRKVPARSFITKHFITRP